MEITGSGSGSGNDVFGKYSTFSNGDMVINSGSTINGDVGSNGKITVNSNPTINGTGYSPYSVSNSKPFAGGCKEVSTAGTLDAASLIPVMPTMTASGTNLAGAGTTLAAGSYYSNSFPNNLNNGCTINTMGAVTIFIKGDMTLNSVNFTGDDITIYTTGSIIFNSTCKIQATTNLKIYAQGSMTLNNTTLDSENLLLQTKGGITFNSTYHINESSTTAVTKIYSDGSVTFNDGTIGGSAGLAVTKSSLTINSTTKANHTVFVTNGSTAINPSQTAGIYANGSLTINSGVTINYSKSIIQALGLGGDPATVTIKQGSWSAQ
jgi:hypothetical protein